MDIIEAAWWISLIVVTTYHLLVFRKNREESARFDAQDLPGVSIVIAVKNGSKTLIQNLPAFCQQTYPSFEIVIVDDHSNDDEKSILEKGIEGMTNVRLIYTELEQGKKNALTFGIQQASYEVILCTDADCYPASTKWIYQMVSHSFEKNMVLGYSPYERKAGLLNRIIRFETIMTGMQYLSWALVGKPYMGVGRNMLYPKALFQKEKPYKDHRHIPYGDDDLWVQKAAAISNVKVCFDKEAHVFSKPEVTVFDWLHQKHRHLSAGHHYGAKYLWQPASYATALIVHWLLLIPIWLIEPGLWFSVFFLLGLLLRWQSLIVWTNKLGDEDTNYWFPILELGYAIYLAGMGLFSIVFKKKTWN